MIRGLGIPNLQVTGSRQTPCFQFRNRGCLPVYLDGARLTRFSTRDVPLEMLGTAIVLLPNETAAYPAGGVHLFSVGFLR